MERRITALAALALAALCTCSGNRSPRSQAEPSGVDRVARAPADADASRARPVAVPVSPKADGNDSVGRVLLDIAARDHAPERPPTGWCAETAIQEALLYYGAFVPQRLINRAGRPKHADLYWSDVPVALEKLGLSYQRTKSDDLAHYIDWLEDEIRAGHPVISGVKIYPTDHPQWGLDHIVLVVGFDNRGGLFINTTWGYRERRTRAQLGSEEKGMSFHNRYGRYYAYAIRGLEHDSPDSTPVRLSVKSEKASELEVAVAVEELQVGKKYRLVRYPLSGSKPVELTAFTAASGSRIESVKLPKSRATVIRCHLVTI